MLSCFFIHFFPFFFHFSQVWKKFVRVSQKYMSCSRTTQKVRKTKNCDWVIRTQNTKEGKKRELFSIFSRCMKTNINTQQLALWHTKNLQTERVNEKKKAAYLITNKANKSSKNISWGMCVVENCTIFPQLYRLQ